MPKVPLSTITSGYGTVDALNANFNAIEAAFDNTLSRDGDTPNQMSANLDMNGNALLNVGTINGAPITALGDLSGYVNTALAAATSAGASATSAANTYDLFDDRYFGSKTSDPTVDNDGNALQVGAEYWNSVSNERRTWTGSAWVTSITVVPDGSVTTAKLVDGSATTAKLADGAAVGAKLGSKIQSISATVAANAITVSASYLSLDFRNTTLTNGTVTTVAGTPANLTIASTDSFGLVTAAGNQRIAILAINNAGTIELAASALVGGVNLDETGVITTVAAATAGAQIKSATARTNVAYRVIGFINATFTTGTGWGSLTVVQGAGGQALAAMSSLGYGQTWQDVAGSRAMQTTYYNTTNKPIMVMVSCFTTTNSTAGFTVSVGGLVLAWVQVTDNNGSVYQAMRNSITFIVPPGASYSADSITTAVTIGNWTELR
jgi:hypothetical protein